MPYPCCCKPKECEFFSDNFDRADSTDLGDKWTVEAGAAEINSGRLRISAVNSRVSCSATHPVPSANYIIEGVCQIGNLLSVGHIYFNYLDANNYYYVEIRQGGAQPALSLRQRRAGVESLVASSNVTNPLAADIPFSICIRNDTAIISAGSNSLRSVLTGTNRLDLDPAGRFGVGSASGFGFAYFDVDNFSISQTVDDQSGCARCTPTLDCHSCCSNSATPESWVVDLGEGGWTNKQCDNCDGVEGEFVVDWDGTAQAINNDCLWGHLSCLWCRDNMGAVIIGKRVHCLPEDEVDEDQVNQFDVRIHLSMLSSPCRVNVEVSLRRYCRPGEGLDGDVAPADCVAHSTATYQSSGAAFQNCEGGPITLTRASNVHYRGVDRPPGSDEPCEGMLPDTIQVWANV